MITFKQYTRLIEELKGKGKDGIYKNPSVAEMSKIPESSRGWISKDGDLYVAASAKRIADLHWDLKKRVVKLYKDDKYKANQIIDDLADNYGITVQRIGKENAFAVGESEADFDAGLGLDSSERPDEKPAELAKVKKYMKLAHKKNPSILFRPVMIQLYDIKDPTF